jgi:hypothetical protein
MLRVVVVENAAVLLEHNVRELVLLSPYYECFIVAVVGYMIVPLDIAERKNIGDGLGREPYVCRLIN